MSQLSAEQLAQRIYDCGLLTAKELDNTLKHAGGRGEASLDDFIMALLEREMLTNWQIARVCEGHRRGYFYGHWKILYLIGAGTFARVYRATDVHSGEIRAVKVLRQRYGNDLETREQFLQEARMVMKLRHPNIVPIYEVEEEKGRIYMVMDFIEGQNLREYVKAHKRLDVEISLKIIRDVAAGLAHAAKFNITHRDMKLSNILLSSKGQAKLVDFGLATVSKGDDDDSRGGPRSIDYAGLERTTGVRRNDKRSDIYFLGCMLYHLVSGVPPLSETRERMKRLATNRFTDVKPVTDHVPDLPHRVVILINRLMDLDVNKRIQTPELVVSEVESALRAIHAGDREKYDARLTEAAAQEYEAKISRQQQGANRTILLIESSEKVQNPLREKLKSLGYRVLITNDLTRGLSRFDDLESYDESPADCVIFGGAGLGKKAIEAFEEFVQGEYTSLVPALLLIPEKLLPRVNPKSIQGHEHRAVITFPLKVKRLCRVLTKLMSVEGVRSTQPPDPSAEPAPIVVNAPANDDTDVDLEE